MTHREQLAKHFREGVLFVNVKYIQCNTFNKLKCCISNYTEKKESEISLIYIIKCTLITDRWMNKL